jgi:hypothetical protein
VLRTKAAYIYRLHRYGVAEYKKVRARYQDKLHILVHELVHYRFAYLGHSMNFEKRIKDILSGKTFQPKHVHTDNA